MTQIIGFAGRKQSGKTTCSNVLKDFILYHNNDLIVNVYNFADPLKKNICIDLLGLTYDQCYGSDEQKNELVNCYFPDNKQMTAREAMQYVGTKFFRGIQENIWVDATMRKIKKDRPDFAIIGDCRFPNEVEAIKNNGGRVIKLTRNPFNSDHASEIALDIKHFDHSKFDFILLNHTMSIEEQNFALIKKL